MRVLFTCGGTAGHINPAVALARLFQARHKDCQVLFAGAENGMECRLVPQEGFDLRTVHVSSISRSISLAGIRHNARTVKNLVRSSREAKAILDDFRPDLVVGTGGYASYPVVRQAAKRGIPTAVHESNAVPGVTTKLLAKVTDLVMVGFEASRAHYPRPERVLVTGTPVRGDFFQYSRTQARQQLGIDDQLPLVLSYWGSLGAEVMNGHMVDFIAQEVAAGSPFHHIHGAGRNFAWMNETLAKRGVQLEGGRVSVREYIYDMPLVMAAADLVICRAGASTISELTAIAKPCILVPSPNVTNNHQEKNARVLEEGGGAVLLLEDACSGKHLYETAQQLLHDEERRKAMARALTGLGMPDAAEEIYRALCSLMAQ